jgi:hypothetical protein
MGLFTRLILLPLAPVEGVLWVADQILTQAEEEFYSPESLQRQLSALQQEMEDGRVTEDEYLHAEDELLDRLDAVRAMEEERHGQSY